MRFYSKAVEESYKKLQKTVNNGKLFESGVAQQLHVFVCVALSYRLEI